MLEYAVRSADSGKIGDPLSANSMNNETQEAESESDLPDSADQQSGQNADGGASDSLPLVDAQTDSSTPIIPDDRPSLPCLADQDRFAHKNVEPPLAESATPAPGHRATDPEWRPSIREHRIEPPADADGLETYGLSEQPVPKSTPTVFRVASGGEAYSVGGSSTPIPPSPQAKMCPACGTAMPDRSNCTSCGWKRKSARVSPPPSRLRVAFSPITDRVIPATIRMYFVLGTYVSAAVLAGLLLAESGGESIRTWLHSFSLNEVLAADVPAFDWPAGSMVTISVAGCFGLVSVLAFLNQLIASSMRVCAESAGTELRADIADAKPLVIFSMNVIGVVTLFALVNALFVAAGLVPEGVVSDFAACLQAGTLQEASGIMNRATTGWLQSGVGPSVWFLVNVCMLVVAPTLAVFSIAAAAIDGKSRRGPAWLWHSLSESWSLLVLIAIVGIHSAALWALDSEFRESVWYSSVLGMVGGASALHIIATLWAIVGQALHRQRKAIRWKGSHASRLTECPACGTSITGVGTTCRECGADMSLETGRGPVGQVGWFASRFTQVIGIAWCGYLASSLVWNPEETAASIAQGLAKSIREIMPF